MSPEDGGSVEAMRSFLSMIGVMLDRKRDFELAQAYLALFLKVSDVRYFPFWVALTGNNILQRWTCSDPQSWVSSWTRDM